MTVCLISVIKRTFYNLFNVVTMTTGNPKLIHRCYEINYLPKKHEEGFIHILLDVIAVLSFYRCWCKAVE